MVNEANLSAARKHGVRPDLYDLALRIFARLAEEELRGLLVCLDSEEPDVSDGHSIFTRTVAEVLGIPEGEVTLAQHTDAKVAYYCAVYGARPPWGENPAPYPYGMDVIDGKPIICGLRVIFASDNRGKQAEAGEER